MARKLLSGFRLRIGDNNFDPPPSGFPYRLTFWDSSTSLPKLVYAGPDVGDTSLGAIVDLDAQGYVPVSGIWLDVGRYNVALEQRIAVDPINGDTWNQLWIINKVEGGTTDGSANDSTIRFVSTIPEIRALTGADLGGITINTGYYTLNDGGQGQWRWISTSLEQDDGGAYLKPTAQSASVPGRWHRVMPDGGEVDVRMWGAVTGQTDVSGNIELAQLWCARTSNDTAPTLAFPAGNYRLGGSVVFDAVGQTTNGYPMRVRYHIHNGATFSGSNIGVGPRFVNEVQIDGTNVINAFLVVTDVVGGEVDPRWWGCALDGVTDDSSNWIYMTNTSITTSLPAYGNNAVALHGDVFIDGEITSTNNPIITFYNGGHITLGTNASSVRINSINDLTTTSATTALITGKIESVQYWSKEFQAKWMRPTTVDMLTKMVQALNYGCFDVYWDYTFTFNANYDSSLANSLINHHLINGASWFINNQAVQVYQMDLPERQCFFFSLAANTGYINILNTWTIKAVWFGAIGANCTAAMKHLFRSVLRYDYDVDFGGARSSVGEEINLIPQPGKVYTFRNLYLAATHTTGNLFTIWGSNAGTAVYFKDCRLSCPTNNNTQACVASAIEATTFDNCEIVGGTLAINNTQTCDVNGCKFSSAYINMTSTQGVQTIKNNKLINTGITLYAGIGLLKTIEIAQNYFNSNLLSESNRSFIYLKPTGGADTIDGVTIHGNVYRNSSTFGNPYGSMIVNVKDLSDATFKWKNVVDTTIHNHHKLTIYDESPDGGLYGVGFLQEGLTLCRITRGKIETSNQSNHGTGHRARFRGRFSRDEESSIGLHNQIFRLNGVTTSIAQITGIVFKARNAVDSDYNQVSASYIPLNTAAAEQYDDRYEQDTRYEMAAGGYYSVDSGTYTYILDVEIYT